MHEIFLLKCGKAEATISLLTTAVKWFNTSEAKTSRVIDVVIVSSSSSQKELCISVVKNLFINSSLG